MHISKTLLTSLFSIIFSHSIFYASTINVPNDYGTIQLGLNNASPGDTVLVQPGTYYENIFWPETNGIKLISVSDSSNTIIDGSGVGTVIYMNPQTATIDTTTLIKGFKITNGGNVDRGGGFYIKNCSPNLVNIFVWKNESTLYGGGIYLEESVCIINNSSIISNVSGTNGGSGGGICIINSAPRLFNSNVISNTSMHGGGGLYSFGGLEEGQNTELYTVLDNVVIQSNQTNNNSRGGGIYLYTTRTSLNNLKILKNTAGQGGGIYIEDPIFSVITDLIINNNSADGSGGGVYSNPSSYWSSTPNFDNCKIVYNEAKRGGGMFLNLTTSITNTIIANNTAEVSGGGIQLHNGVNNQSLFINSTICNNSSKGQGDGIYGLLGSSVSNVNFANNGVSWLNVDNSNIVNASDNYWGHSSGPYHPSQNPTGQGDSTNIFVNITPWLSEQNVLAPPLPVENVQLTDFGSNFATLSWDPSPIGDLAGYKIYYDTDDEDFPYRFSVDVGNKTSHTIDNLINTATYFFAVVTYDIDGNESWYTKANESVRLAAEEESINLPNSIGLTNFPNPFNPSTTIHYTLPEESEVEIIIYDLVGKKVAIIMKSTQPSGTHSLQWNGTDQQGNLVPAGIYFYQLRAGDFVQTKKMVLMK